MGDGDSGAQVTGLVIDITRPAQRVSDTPGILRRHILFAGFLTLAALLALGATPSGMAPVPAQYLHGLTFHSPDDWFQVDVPAGWEWFEMRAFDGQADPRWPDAVNQSVAWWARHPKTLDDVVVLETYTPGGDVIIGAYAKDFETRTRKAVEPDTMVEFSTETLVISGERSLRYRYKVVRKSKPPLYRFGYVTGMEHKVIISTSDEKPVEPKRLTQAAHSLRWLKMP